MPVEILACPVVAKTWFGGAGRSMGPPIQAWLETNQTWSSAKTVSA